MEEEELLTLSAGQALPEQEAATAALNVKLRRKDLVGVLGVAGLKDENVASSLPHFMTSNITSKL